MEDGVTTSKQLDVLFEQGGALVHEFCEEQLTLQKQEEKARQEACEDGEQEQPEEDEQDAKEPATKEMDFDLKYQRWYSISLTLMKQLAPERCAEFQAYYQPDPKRGEVGGYNYVIQDWFRYRGFDVETSYQPWAAVGQCFVNQLTILKSIRDRLEWQALTTDDHVERALQLGLLKTARDLIKVSERAAGALAGTMLQAYLKRLAAKHQVKLRKQSPTAGELVDALKAARVLDVPAWSQATWLAQIHERVTAREGGNADFAGAKICQKTEGEAPTRLQVRDLIDGTHWLITNVF